MTFNENANRETLIGDEYITDTINPVPRRSFIETKLFNGVLLYHTPYNGYWVSECGDVYSDRNTKITHKMTQYLSDGRYLSVYLYMGDGRKSRKKMRVHRLMMETFYGICPKKYSVDHKDGVKTNNHISNLRYITQQDNVRRVCCGKSKVLTYKSVCFILDDKEHHFNTITDFMKIVEGGRTLYEKIKLNTTQGEQFSRYIILDFENTEEHLFVRAKSNENFVRLRDYP